MLQANPYLERIHQLNVNRHGERRAPHKPLLLLMAIARLLRGERELPFKEVESTLKPLLMSYAPPVKARHQPELPYWHLRSDGLWDIPEADSLPLQAGGFPRMAALRASAGHLTSDFAAALLANPDLAQAAIRILLDDHFPESLHEDILASVGLEWPESTEVDGVADGDRVTYSARRRDPKFRQEVLRAYEHRCAVTGFQIALGGSYFGCEAAHVQWHAYGGPDTVENGFAVEPTLHKLFDAGAWTLTDERRVLVSAELTGADETVQRIRSLHGEAMRAPLSGASAVSVEYIRWHREEELGGVFKYPALPL
jgi:putative restriction endonuclease